MQAADAGPQRAVTVATHRGRVCSHTAATVHTALGPGGRACLLQAPCSWGTHICAGVLPPSVPLPRHVSVASRGTGVTVLPASHLQGNLIASHRTGPAEREADSGKDKQPFQAHLKDLAFTLLQHQALLTAVERKPFTSPSSRGGSFSPASAFFLSFTFRLDIILINSTQKLQK